MKSIAFVFIGGLFLSMPGFILASEKTRLSFEEVKQSALKKFPGSILDSEIDIENGVLVYEFTIKKTDGSVIEVEFNAYNGSVISIE